MKNDYTPPFVRENHHRPPSRGPLAVGALLLLNLLAAAPARAAVTYQVIKSFTLSEGENPSIIEASDGAIYGTTGNGGAYDSGTLFKLNKDGSGYTLLHSFSPTDFGGAVYPRYAPVEGSDGALYGCTAGGLVSGRAGPGTVYKVNKDGSGYTTLHFFRDDGSDGREPRKLVAGSGGMLFGTTDHGGSGGANVGTVFGLSMDGSRFTSIWSFTFGDDGAFPLAGLIKASDGAIYGMTEWGDRSYANIGTIFSFTQDGNQFSIVHRFDDPWQSSGGDAAPDDRLLEASDGVFYGTALDGGGPSGYGFAFKINKDGTGYAVLHEFGETSGDLVFPAAGLVEGDDGELYGSSTALFGDFGGVFRMKKDGSAYTLVHRFNRSDGASCAEALIKASDGAFYGTTTFGGAYDQGVIFRLRPAYAGLVPPGTGASGGTGGLPPPLLITKVAVGAEHSLFTRSDGSLWGMGDNSYGQLGDQTIISRHTPVQIVSHGVIAVAAGAFHSLFLKSDGSLWGMGRNDHGQLGDGTTSDRHRPTFVANGVTAMSAGDSDSLFMKSDGTLWSLWGMGLNDVGQLGDGTTIDRHAPVQIVSSGVIAVSAGGGHSLFLKTGGSLWGMGENITYQLGDGTTADHHVPVQILPTGVSAIGASSRGEELGAGGTDVGFSLFVGDGGSLWGMGDKTFWQLGDDGTPHVGWTYQKVPEQIVSSGVTAVATLSGSSLFLKSDGSVWGMGDDQSCELGDQTGSDDGFYHNPKQIFSSGVTAIAAGGHFSLFLKSDGTLWAVGDNSSGQLGDGTTLTRCSPVQVLVPTSSGSPVGGVSAGKGNSHTLFLRTDGSLWAMGENSVGQLGDGTYLERTEPVEIVARDVTAISAGNFHSLFVEADGSLWGMGDNTFGELGDGSFGSGNHTNTPERIVSSGVTSISAGNGHSLFIESDGGLWAMGHNANGQLGDGSTNDSHIPEQILSSNVTAVAAGDGHSLFLKSDGSLWAMGANDSGQLGDGTTIESHSPAQIVSNGVVAVSAGSRYGLFLMSDGSLWAMGANDHGQLGDGTTTESHIPEQIVSGGVVAISAGTSFSLFLKSDGSLWGMGGSDDYQLGGGLSLDHVTPVMIVSSGVNAISAGGQNSLFVKSDGSLWGMGSNDDGELGDGTIAVRRFPEQTISGPPPHVPTPVTAIAAGVSDSFFLTPGGALWGMGDNDQGQLGDGTAYPTATPHHTPTAIVSSNVIAMAAGESHCLVLKSDGSLWGIGYNADGELGDGTTTERHAPEQIISDGVTAAAAGYLHSLFLKSDGSLWGMGYNGDGELGDGTTGDRHSPVLVTNGVAAIAAGGYHSLLLLSDGSLWGMGYNGDGELGDGTTTNRQLPVLIVSSNVTAIAGGEGHSLFLKSDGSLWAMGWNGFGQLGDGTTNDSHLPEQIVSSNVTAIAAGGGHSLFIKSDGSLWGMGWNGWGQLGDGLGADQYTPKQLQPSGVTAIACSGEHSLFIMSDGSLWAMGDNSSGQLGDGTLAVAFTMERIVAAPFVPPPTAVPPPAGLVAWWRGEGDAQDSAGINHGVPLNGVGFVAGKVGQAFSFDGVDDMVAIPEAPAIDLSRMPAWTVEAWVRPTSFTSQIHPTIYSEGRWGVSLGLQNGTGNLETWINNSAVFRSTMALPINTWSHVSLTHGAGNFSFYINGNFAGSFAATILPDSNGSAIGDVPFNPNSTRFQGQIDEVSIYERALTGAELVSIYNAGPAGKTISGPYFATLPLLPNGMANQGYTQTIAAVRGTAPVAYTITSGALPPGLALNSSGVLSGTPVGAGLFNFVVRATDAASLYAEESFSLLVFAPVAAPSGLAAWWRAENDALDSVAANNGVALNGVSFAAGEVGQAFSFDGVDDMVTIPESPAIDLSRMPAWTVEAWVRPTSFTNQIYPTIYSEGSWGVSLGLQNETGNLETWINNNAAFHSTMALPINVWSHVALTYSAGDFSFYINGIFAGSFAATILPDSNGSAIGAVPLNPDSSQFQGQIDELSVYQRALTDTELTSIYNAGPAGKTISGLSFATQPRLPDALVNQAYTQTITAVRGTAPVAYTITSGALPPGLALNSSGVLDGTSAAAGLFNFVVRATDAASLYVEESFSLQVFAPAAAPSGLAAWWRAENDALDSVGANNGVALNGVGFGAGKVGQAFSFDGVDDRIAIPEASAIDLSTMPAWTVEAWVRPASFTSQNYPTIYSEGSWGVSLGLQNGTGKLETWINNSAVFRSTMALPINAWSHVALTHSAGNFAFYINGNFAGSFAATILPDSNGSAIGDVPLNPDSSRFQGQIDEVSIYQRALTDTELVAIYNAGLAGKSLAAVSLALQLSATNTVLVLWPSYPAGFLLQENTNLSSTNWTSSSGLVNDDGTNKFIVVNPPVGARFYRLARP